MSALHITHSEVAPETGYFIYRDPAGTLMFMGVPVTTMAAMANFLHVTGLTSYDDVQDLVKMTEKAINGN